ncbi:MAG: hypothetical protein AAF226_03485 [Verrucomicrobiota bacterium]
MRKGKDLRLTQNYHVAAGKDAIQLSLLSTDMEEFDAVTDPVKIGSAVFQVATDSADQLTWKSVGGRLTLEIAPSDQEVSFAINRSVGNLGEIGAVKDLKVMAAGGDRNWPTTYTVKGELSSDQDSSYVLDTIPVPFENEYQAWMRTSALAFFDDGRAALTTYGGDVWIVSGIDENLEKVTWSRFASGMFEAFGCEIVDGLIYVTTRNGIVRLHDLNDDGEADFYEQFFADPDVSPKWHAYSFDLVRDGEGYFYYARNGQFTESQLEGGAYKVSPDGQTHELYCSGFRTPNGMGILPDGRLTYGDNQGSYVPAGKLTIGEPGKWHGATNLAGEAGEKRDRVEPILWFPQEVDNSCGGQHFINDERFGPYDQYLVHTSCGKAEAMMVFMDELPDGTIQASSQTFPFAFQSGVMRPLVNPTDGQLYITGTRGWQIKADYDGCLQRIRYTGKTNPLLLEAKARQGGIELTFSEPIDQKSALAESFQIEQWNYLWAKTYGSKKYSVVTPDQEGTDVLSVGSTNVSGGGKTVWIEVPDLKPCHNLSLNYQLKDKQGRAVENSVNMTLHQLPKKKG